MNAGDLKGPLRMPSQTKELADAWILDRYNSAVKISLEQTLKFNMSAAANALYHFLWDDFCDWYIELAKPRFETDREYVVSLLVNILYGTLKALHPMTPFITEELAEALKPLTGSGKEFLLQDTYPSADGKYFNPSAVREMEIIKGIISAVRTVRSEFNVPPGLKLNISFKTEDAAELKIITERAGYIKQLCKIENFAAGRTAQKKPKSAAAVFSNTAAYIELEGIIDAEKEKARLEKNIAAATSNAANRRARLSDARFMKNAPAEQIEKVKTELAAEELKLKSAQTALKDLQ